MPIDPAKIGFTAVSAEHLPLVGQWLNAPHMRDWWGEPETELDYIRDMIAGRDTTRPFLFFFEGEPIGYIQCWFIADNQVSPWIDKEPWVADLSRDAVGVDLSIGEPEMLSKGIGTAALIAFVARLRAEGRETIIIDPSPANRRAVRAYEKAGFRAIDGMEKWQPDVLLMQHEPNASWTHI